MKRLLLLLCCIAAPTFAHAATTPPIAYLGIEFRWGSDPSADRFLHVARVAPSGPAEKAGIRPGDLITQVGGVRVDFGDELDFLNFLRKRRPGERLSLTVVRAGKAANHVVVLAALPESARPRWELNFRIAQERRAAAKSTQRRK